MEGWKSFELFEREIEALKKLNHPQIPRYLDSFSSDDKDFFLVQDFIDAPSLGERVSEGKGLKNGDVLKIGLQILDILQYLRSMQPAIVHRDIKPSNILYREDGKIFLVDFGLVASPLKAQGRGSTIAGSFGYMPPEQLMGKSDPASDIYALFATLFELFCGVSPAEVPIYTYKLQTRPYLRHLPYDLYLLMQDCLEPEMDKRLNDIEQIRERLCAIADIFDGRAKGKNWPPEEESEEEGQIAHTKYRFPNLPTNKASDDALSRPFSDSASIQTLYDWPYNRRVECVDAAFRQTFFFAKKVFGGLFERSRNPGFQAKKAHPPIHTDPRYLVSVRTFFRRCTLYFYFLFF